jgi:UDP-sulfoquinovose synthase
MRILVLGGDGYLGWPTAMHLAARGHEVLVMDNYLKRHWAQSVGSESLLPNPNLMERAKRFQTETGHVIRVEIGDVTDFQQLLGVFRSFQPEAVVHYAEQPSGAFSMIGQREAMVTIQNNLSTTLNLVWAVLSTDLSCHIVKLGTMGEYGTPNVDIPEGWLDVEIGGRKDKLLFPRAAGSLYHTTKIMDTDLLWFYCRMRGLRVTDLMQGPVYGISTPEADIHSDLMPSFHYDDIFGTVLNRFLCQAVSGHPLTVYGDGSQVRGYLNLRDTLACVDLALRSPVKPGELRVLNQITETFSVQELAERVRAVWIQMGHTPWIQHMTNPRKEEMGHHYQPTYTGLLDLGLEPHFLTDDVLAGMLRAVEDWAHIIDPGKFMPRVRWNTTGNQNIKSRRGR